MQNIQQPLTNAQLEILKAFSFNLNMSIWVEQKLKLILIMFIKK